MFVVQTHSGESINPNICQKHIRISEQVFQNSNVGLSLEIQLERLLVQIHCLKATCKGSRDRVLPELRRIKKRVPTCSYSSRNFRQKSPFGSSICDKREFVTKGDPPKKKSLDDFSTEIGKHPACAGRCHNRRKLNNTNSSKQRGAISRRNSSDFRPWRLIFHLQLKESKLQNADLRCHFVRSIPPGFDDLQKHKNTGSCRGGKEKECVRGQIHSRQK